jgi:hypothetical protein
MHPGDFVALELQELFRAGAVDTALPLLRIDCRSEAAEAPFRFDMVEGKLHRAGCSAIPRPSLSALYSVWETGDDSAALACPRCKPVPGQATPMKRDTSLDFLYGFLSIVDQFGSVLKERGREYRNSTRGRQLSKELTEAMEGLEKPQREALKVAVDSLDGLIKAIQQVNKALEGHTANGNGAGAPGGNGHRTNGTAKASSARAQTSKNRDPEV